MKYLLAFISKICWVFAPQLCIPVFYSNLVNLESASLEVYLSLLKVFVALVGSGVLVLYPTDSRKTVRVYQHGFDIVPDDVLDTFDEGKELTDVDGLVSKVLIEYNLASGKVHSLNLSAFVLLGVSRIHSDTLQNILHA